MNRIDDSAATRKFSVALMFTVLFLASGCARSRVSQCRSLVQKINAADAAVSKPGHPRAKGDELGSVAVSIEAAEADLRSVALSDDRLEQLRRDYMKALQSNLDRLHEAATEERRIVNNLNVYCGHTQ
jgi:hypothetical protein